MTKIKIGITGGAGYTGGELIRILLNHPSAELAFVQSRSNAGQLLSSVHQDLSGDTDMRFSEALSQDIDVLFLCVGHGEAGKFLSENKINPDIRLIDLSQDFRLLSNNKFLPYDREFIYGLPELNREKIKTARNIANPGCFATTIELGLVPLAAQGWLSEVYTTGITGSTGAGQGLSSTSHFPGDPIICRHIKHLYTSISQRLMSHLTVYKKDSEISRSILFHGAVTSPEEFL